MEILLIRTPLLRAGDDLARILADHGDIRTGDIVVISSKAAATAEGASIDLSLMRPGAEAKRLAKESGRDAAFIQCVLNETKRLDGRVIGATTGAILTELQPVGFGEGVLLVPNAGLDQSNVEEGFAIGWPGDPVGSVRELREALRGGARRARGMQGARSDIAVILSDSCCAAGRLGVTAFGLACAGIDPFLSLIGKPDAFGRTMHMTYEAVADQLATAANAVMGNSSQMTPAAIVRGHGYALSAFAGWVPGMAKEKDLFARTMQR